MKVAIDGGELYYATHGAGRPLVVMHGGLGPDHTYFRPWLDALGDEIRLIYYDHRGGGRSSRLESFDGITNDTLTDDTDRLREHLGYDRIVLLGHSYGGMLALEYALRHPDRLAGLILCCTAPAWDYGDEIDRLAAARGAPRSLEARERDRDRVIESDEVMRRHWVDIQPLYFHRVDPEIITAMDDGMIYSAAAFNLSEILLADWNVSGRLPEITVPTLVICGRDAWVTPPSQAERMMAALPNATLAMFEESGHYPFAEEHERFTATIRDWVSALD